MGELSFMEMVTVRMPPQVERNRIDLSNKWQKINVSGLDQFRDRHAEQGLAGRVRSGGAVSGRWTAGGTSYRSKSGLY